MNQKRTNLKKQKIQDKYSLVVKDLHKWFGGLHAVRGINLSAKIGERLAIIGPNGAGKTTLFNLICGAIPPSKGKIYIFDKEVTKLPCHKRVYCGLSKTFQVTSLFFNLTLLENVILALQGIEKCKFSCWTKLKNNRDLQQKAEELLSKVSLWSLKNEKVASLSYGDQRLIELLLALASRPRIIALDEPTAGLSMAESKTLLKIINGLGEDITVLLIEHDMDIAFEVAQRIMVLDEGEVIALDTPENIRNNKKVQDVYLGRSES